MQLSIAHVSDVGRVRSGNEDSVLCTAEPGSLRGGLLVLADGMGGAEAGEVASRMAVETVTEVYNADDGPPSISLRRAIAEANSRIHTTSEEEETTRGMGTTCTAVVAFRNKLYVAHVGDSRAYRLRNGSMDRLTSDHSVWAEHVRSGDPRFSPAITSGRNQLTRAVGIEPRIESDVTEADLHAGDRLVLCSDGLWGLVTDAEIMWTVASNPPPEACRRLVAMANDRGGHDNVSVVVAEAIG